MHFLRKVPIINTIKDFLHKYFVPKGLFARSLLMIILPLLLLQLVISVIFYEQHWHIISQKMARSITSDISFVLSLLEQAKTEEEKSTIITLSERNLSISFFFDEKDELPIVVRPASRVVMDELDIALQKNFGDNFIVEEGSMSKTVTIYLRSNLGIAVIIVPVKRFFSSTAFVFPAWLFGSGFLLFAVAALFMRIQVRSIRRLAEVADAFGKGQDMPNFKPEGAKEVRQAAQAFIAMRDRIKRQLDERTAMLAGVSHDLRTPITRIKLELAMMKDAWGKDNIAEDIKEMENMIEGYLAFARGEGKESFKRIEVSSIIKEVVAKMRKNLSLIDLNIEQPQKIVVRKQDFSRCIANILGNAARYATKASVNMRTRDNMLEITIDDNGPGIPDKDKEEVFKAFYRLEASRNQQTGGVGLGLTITRDIVLAHGGEIRLEKSHLGGLKVRLRFPL